MLLLLSHLALAASGTADAACLDALPDLSEKAERRGNEEIRAMIALNQRPASLVPLKFEALGVDRYKGTWRDEAGGRWSWSQVRTLFDDEPYSRAHLDEMRSAASLAREEAASATMRRADLETAGLISAKFGVMTKTKYRDERELYKRRMAGADALGAGEYRYVARAMCAFNMAPKLHAEETAERQAQEEMMAKAKAAGGRDAAMWNLARMLQDNRGAGAPGLAAAEAVQRCIDAGASTGDLMSAADRATSEGTLADALATGGLDCGRPR